MSKLGAQTVTVNGDWGEYSVTLNVVDSLSDTSNFGGYKIDYTLSATRVARPDSSLALGMT